MSALTLVNLSSDVESGLPVMPLGCLSLTASLEAAGHVVDFRDVQLMPELDRSSEALADVFETDRPVLGVSLMADRMAEAVVALRIFKSRHPDALVVLGGAGPTVIAESLIRAYPFIDMVVRGEGEQTMLEVMSALRTAKTPDWIGVPGLTANVDGRLVSNPDRPRNHDLDSLPAAHCAKLDLSPYPEVALVTARGCPFRCSFCSIVTLWGRQVVRRSIAPVVDELAWHASHKPGAFVHLEDDTFTLDARRVHAFCDALDRRGLEVAWGCNGRVDLVDEPLIERMVASGCRSMFLGIESGSDRVRRRVHKTFTSRQVLERIDMLSRHVRVTASYIWGFPFEELSDFHETFLHVAYLTARGVQTNYAPLVPFARSELFEEYSGTMTFRATSPFPRVLQVNPKDPCVEEVRAHPEVFAQYYSLETPNEQEKIDFVSRFTRFEMAS